MKQYILLILAPLLLCCKEESKQKKIKDTPPAIAQETSRSTGDNSENALDWAGTYKGILPCSDCDGIETEITLNKNLSYSLKSTYLKNKKLTIYEVGTFSWNKEGNKITTISNKNESKSYAVGEHRLTILNADGKENTDSKLAEYYVLKQVPKIGN